MSDRGDDPAVRAGIEAGGQHYVPTPGLGIRCSCGADIPTLADREEHFTTVRVEAARPIIEAEVRARVIELEAIVASDEITPEELAAFDRAADNREPT